jgi:hypothetical protein
VSARVRDVICRPTVSQAIIIYWTSLPAKQELWSSSIWFSVSSMT